MGVSNATDEEPAPLWWSCRLTLALISFVGFANMFMLRSSINVALVCMVNHTAVRELITAEEKENDTSRSLALGLPSSVNNQTTWSCEDRDAISSNHVMDGEFVWPKKLQGIVLGSFYCGYTLTQIIGGWLSIVLGGKRLLGYALLLNAMCALLVPVGARTSVYLLISLQTVCGICQGTVWPAMQVLWTRWAPPLELGKLSAVTFSGMELGIVLTFPVGAFMCKSGIDGGWPSIFYVFGGTGIVWFIAWMYLVADTPDTHPRISKTEQLYITRSTGHRFLYCSKQKSFRVPWIKILTSRAVWAMIVVHTTTNLADYIFVTNIPTYMKEVLKIDIQKSGLLSSVPYIIQWILCFVSGYLFDFVRSRGFMSRKSARKAGNSIGCFGQSIAVLILAFLSCSQATEAVAALMMGIGLCGFFLGAGYCSNAIDFAPPYAGVIFGISNTIAAIPGFVGPTLVGYITKTGSGQEWQTVFFCLAALSAFGGIFGLLFTSGEVQSWARDQSSNLSVNYDEQIGLKKTEAMDRREGEP